MIFDGKVCNTQFSHCLSPYFNDSGNKKKRPTLQKHGEPNVCPYPEYGLTLADQGHLFMKMQDQTNIPGLG